AVGASIGGLTGAFNAAINGGNLGDVLRGAVVGALQGGISGGILSGWESAGWNLQTLQHVAGHGVLGGAANEALGGKFQDGFLSAAASTAAGDLGFLGDPSDTGMGAVVSRTAKASVVGGTASVIGGGKFANGAYTSAFQHLLNAELIPRAEKLLSSDFLEIAYSQSDVTEKTHAATIIKYHASTSLDSDYHKPSIAWCSSFCNWVFEFAGYTGTNSAGSQSWLKWGKSVDEPVVGALAVFTTAYKENKKGELQQVQGHVTFVKGITKSGLILGYGGNQGNRVKLSEYSTSTSLDSKARPLGFRGYRIPSWQQSHQNIKAPILNGISSPKNESTR
ncbi:MAG: TIGR02594 family protein, partial [Akkermansiaceae bacterium]